MLYGTATPNGVNDTSEALQYKISECVKSNTVAEWIDHSYGTNENYQLYQIYSFAQGMLKSSSDSISSKIESNSLSKEKQAVFDNLEQRIFRKLRFPEQWTKEGVSKPNAAAKEKCLAYCKEMFDKYLLIPDLILSSKEDGVYISYDLINDTSNRTLILEIYNNLEAALIVCDNATKKTIYSEDLFEMNFKDAIEVFKA